MDDDFILGPPYFQLPLPGAWFCCDRLFATDVFHYRPPSRDILELIENNNDKTHDDWFDNWLVEEGYTHMTPREREVATLRNDGYTYYEIAAILRRHRSTIYRRRKVK